MRSDERDNLTRLGELQQYTDKFTFCFLGSNHNPTNFAGQGTDRK